MWLASDRKEDRHRKKRAGQRIEQRKREADVQKKNKERRTRDARAKSAAQITEAASEQAQHHANRVLEKRTVEYRATGVRSMKQHYRTVPWKQKKNKSPLTKKGRTSGKPFWFKFRKPVVIKLRSLPTLANPANLRHARRFLKHKRFTMLQPERFALLDEKEPPSGFSARDVRKWNTHIEAYRVSYRTQTRAEIMSELIRAGIRPNPGPGPHDQCPFDGKCIFPDVSKRTVDKKQRLFFNCPICAVECYFLQEKNGELIAIHPIEGWFYQDIVRQDALSLANGQLPVQQYHDKLHKRYKDAFSLLRTDKACVQALRAKAMDDKCVRAGHKHAVTASKEDTRFAERLDLGWKRQLPSTTVSSKQAHAAVVLAAAAAPSSTSTTTWVPPPVAKPPAVVAVPPAPAPVPAVTTTVQGQAAPVPVPPVAAAAPVAPVIVTAAVPPPPPAAVPAPPAVPVAIP